VCFADLQVATTIVNQITTVTYSVDQFLFLSGFLVTYLFVKTVAVRAVTLKTWFMFYFHRIWRLSPPMVLGMARVCRSFKSSPPLFVCVSVTNAYCRMGVAILVWWQIAQYCGDGPLYAWNQETNIRQCNDYWWSSFLYINNFVPTTISQGCFGWGWYLAADMQFYVLTPIVLIIYMKSKIAGVAFTGMLR
jgi:peptidoglycan/LPS O-acetylase OafA/YrhL